MCAHVETLKHTHLCVPAVCHTQCVRSSRRSYDWVRHHTSHHLRDTTSKRCTHAHTQWCTCQLFWQILTSCMSRGAVTPLSSPPPAAAAAAVQDLVLFNVTARTNRKPINTHVQLPIRALGHHLLTFNHTENVGWESQQEHTDVPAGCLAWASFNIPMLLLQHEIHQTKTSQEM